MSDTIQHVTFTNVNEDNSIDTLYPTNYSEDVIVKSENSNLPNYKEDTETSLDVIINNLKSTAFGNRINLTGKTVNIDNIMLSSTESPQVEYYIVETVYGSQNIMNTPESNSPFVLDVEVLKRESETNFITKQTYRNAYSRTYDYIRFCVNGIWDSEWTKRDYSDTVIPNINPIENSEIDEILNSI